MDGRQGVRMEDGVGMSEVLWVSRDTDWVWTSREKPDVHSDV